MMMDKEKRKAFVNKKEASEILGVCTQTMKKILTSKGFISTRLGREILIEKEFLFKYMREHPYIRY